jgi:hypothetical protein
MTPRVPRIVLAGVLGAPLAAQSFVDLTEARTPANPYSSLFEVEAGAIGTQAVDEDATVGLVNDLSWDGHVYYRDDAFSSRRGTLEAYAGRDGLYAGFYDGKMVGDETVTRFEFRARPWQFYRDGAYRGSNFVPNGLFEGSDYEGYLGFGKEAQQGLYVEFGPFYQRKSFRRSSLAVGSLASFAIPEDYAAYGGRLYVEQNTAQMDRRRGIAQSGYVLTLIGEREWNDNAGLIGNSVSGETELPSGLWRARARIEWYIPSSDTMTWEVYGRGGWSDQKDRVVNDDSSRPLGDQWADLQARLRINIGNSWTVTPYVQGQYSKLQGADSASDTRKFFFGGGVETYFHLSEAFSVHGFYSYLDNESRPSIRVDEDAHGEHMFYVGLVMRFGAQRR